MKLIYWDNLKFHKVSFYRGSQDVCFNVLPTTMSWTPTIELIFTIDTNHTITLTKNQRFV